MIKCDFLHELHPIDEELYLEFKAALDGMDADALLGSFEKQLGGSVFVIETPADLKEIYAVDSSGQQVDIRNRVVIFDSAHYFCSKKWMLFFTATTDAGGDSYLVPSSFGKAYVTLVESIRRTDEAQNQSLIRTFRGPLRRVKRVSPASGLINELLIPFTDEQMHRHVNGELIQVAMPHLTGDEKEFIQSGITGEEWDLVNPNL
jgi:hypothetical protein